METILGTKKLSKKLLKKLKENFIKINPAQDISPLFFNVNKLFF